MQNVRFQRPFKGRLIVVCDMATWCQSVRCWMGVVKFSFIWVSSIEHVGKSELVHKVVYRRFELSKRLTWSDVY